MIISASRRTDIPALYAPWFAERLRAGFCRVANPFNPRQISRVSLRPEDVDAIVFWTRHPRPLFDVLPLLERRGYRFYFQYTITGYGRPIERRTPPLEVALRTFTELADRRPPGSVVWRYDPILIGASLPVSEHLARFRRIATALEGRARRVVVSVVDLYRKTERRVGAVMPWDRDLLREPRSWAGLPAFLAELATVAGEHGMAIESCAEEADWSALGIGATKCIDDRLLTELFGGAWPVTKDRGQRPACGCIPSRDIGAPDTCTFGCRYCYATRSDALARKRRREHDPTGPALWSR